MVAVTIASIMENTKSQIAFYILDNNISSLNKKKIIRFLKKYSNCSTNFININSELFARFPETFHYSKAMYSRYLIPEIQSNLKKVIYTDVDVIFLNDIKEFFDINLDGYGLAAPIEEIGQILENAWDFNKRKKELGISFSHKFFQSGNLLIDCEYWKNNKITEQLLRKTEEKSNKLLAPDLEILNIIFENNYKKLDYRYSVCVHMINNQNKNLSVMKESLKNPYLIHYSGNKKPWNCHTKYSWYFWKYARKTPFFYNLIVNYIIQNTKLFKKKKTNIKNTTVNTNSEISVVLNLYKRPENLKVQLEALEKQTLKPKEIILYQDGTSDTIKIPDDIKEKFAIIEIGTENKGVWARFDFAKRKSNCEYVCIFDDDTIPGSRWLENCMNEMEKQEGLYVTIGILMDDAEKYPYSNYFRTGWDGNNNETLEVDFGGHSWFFKKDWLTYLFEDSPKEIQQFKLAGEDMAFSYALNKHNIGTFVPPHPKNNKELYGSIPKKAWKLGTSKNAISTNVNNLALMNNAIKILLDNDWKTLTKRNPEYFKKVCKQQKSHNNFIQNIFSIKNKGARKIITILGIKLSIKV